MEKGGKEERGRDERVGKERGEKLEQGRRLAKAGPANNDVKVK